MSVQIVEVGPRDGLQNEGRILSQAQRLRLIQHLLQSGLKRVDVGAFVSPKWVPQMAHTDAIIQSIYKGNIPSDVRFSALVPNVKGMENALATPIAEVAVFGACTESFSKHNINCTIAQSIERFTEIVKMANQHKRKVRGYLS